MLIGQGTAYALHLGSDQLLLGLKANLKECEIGLPRQRSLSSRYGRALAVIAAPVGSVKVGLSEKDLDRESRQSIDTSHCHLGHACVGRLTPIGGRFDSHDFP